MKIKNKKIDYEYYSLNNGVKEEVVLYEKPSTNVFEFKYELKKAEISKKIKKLILLILWMKKHLKRLRILFSPNIIEQDGTTVYDNIEYNVYLQN